MKSFVVQTYYQLMHSIAMALTFDEKPGLYFAMRYLNAEEDFIDRIRETEVFHHVTGIDRRGDLTEFVSELDRTSNMSASEIDETGNSLFEKYLEPYYEELFKEADKEEQIYIYNDYHWYFYYVSKHFKYIVGVEDGYASLAQQLKMHRFAGDRELVKPFLGKYYPEPGFKHPSIHEIISSRNFDDLPEEFRNKIKIVDFKELVDENRSAFGKAIDRIFETENLTIDESEVLFLAQALARSMHCLSIEEYLLNKKIIRGELEQGRRVCFKSHPADVINGKLYERKGVQTLSGSFPVEVLNYKGCSFEKTLSFGSTGVETLDCSESTELVFGNRTAERKEVEAYIKDQIREERAIIDVYIITRDLTTDTLVHAFSSDLSSERNFETRLRIIVPEEKTEAARSFFRKNRLPEAIEEYKRTHLHNGVCLNEDELDELNRHSSGFNDPEIIPCDNPEAEGGLLKIIDPDREDYDYAFFADQDSLLFNVMKSAVRSLKKQVVPCVVFPSYSMIRNKKMEQPWISLHSGFIDRSATADLINKFTHRAVIQAMNKNPDRDSIEIIESLGQPTIWFSNDLYVPTEWFTDIEDGEGYYSGKISRMAGGDGASEDEHTKSIASDIYAYLNWLQLSDKKYGADEIDAMLNIADVTDRDRVKALEELCSTLYYEKYRRFRSNFGPDHEAKKYLKEKIGFSRKVIGFTNIIDKIRKIKR